MNYKSFCLGICSVLICLGIMGFGASITNVLDSLTVNGDAVISGDVGISGNTYLTGGLSPYPLAEATLKGAAATTAGMIYYDTTNKAVIVSTGTAAGQFGQIVDGTARPTGW